MPKFVPNPLAEVQAPMVRMEQSLTDVRKELSALSSLPRVEKHLDAVERHLDEGLGGMRELLTRVVDLLEQTNAQLTRVAESVEADAAELNGAAPRAVKGRSR